LQGRPLEVFALFLMVSNFWIVSSSASLNMYSITWHSSFSVSDIVEGFLSL
jgi:hypothetical protein